MTQPKDTFPHILHVFPGCREAEWCREGSGILETGILPAVPMCQGRCFVARFEPWQMTLPLTGPPQGGVGGGAPFWGLWVLRGAWRPQGADWPADPA